MSRTPVSEFNARMGLDISPLEQAVPRATALLRKLSSVQAEAFAAQSGGPDMQAMTERMRSASKSPQRLGLGGGSTATFKDPASAQEFTDPIGAANEASLKRTALRQQEMQRAQKAASDSYMADVRMIDAALEQTAARQMQRAQERQDFEDSLAQRRITSAQSINEFETQRSNLIRNSAKESAAAFQADFRATEARLAAEQEIAQRRIASAQTINEFETQRSSLIQNSARESAAAFQADFRAADERIAAEQEIAQRRITSAQSINEFETQRSSLIQNSAKESAAVFQADFRAAQADIDAALERQGIETEIAAIRRRQAQVQTASRFDLANPFQQQILSVQELNRLLVVRRGLQRGTVEFAQAELAVTQQIARVRGIRDNLTVGAEGMRRLGNTAADSQKGFARFGLGMQQVGYQVQDFAVQIQSGTSALTALSQQGSQVLGFFGGFYGAVAGAALSVGILAYKLIDQAKGTEEVELKFKNLNDALKENIRLTRERILLTDPSAKIGFLEGDVNKSKEELAKAKAEQERRRLAVERANKAMELRVSLGDRDAEAARNLGQYLVMLLEDMGLREATLVTANAQVEATSTELEVAKEVVATSNELFSSKAEVLAATEKQRQADYLAFAQARKQNALDSMSNDQQIDYYVDRMKFLKEIGAQETEEYEIAKKRVKDLGTIALSNSGPKTIKNLKEMYEKTVLGLQSGIPDALQVNGGASALGGTVGSGSANQLIDIQKAILDGIRQLVRMESIAGAN